MEPIISKLQEGVKYPRFERDATTIINDLVEHITKERGVYSSSIEPNPSEHNIWFNTDTNIISIYSNEDNVWKSISSDLSESKINTDIYSIKPFPYINIMFDKGTTIELDLISNVNYILLVNAININYYIKGLLDYNGIEDYIILSDGNVTSYNGSFMVFICGIYIWYINIGGNFLNNILLSISSGAIALDYTDNDGNHYKNKQDVTNYNGTYESLIDDIGEGNGGVINNCILSPNDGASITIFNDNNNIIAFSGVDVDDSIINIITTENHYTLKFDAEVDTLNYYTTAINIYGNNSNITIGEYTGGNEVIIHESYIKFVNANSINIENGYFILDYTNIYIIGSKDNEYPHTNVYIGSDALNNWTCEDYVNITKGYDEINSNKHITITNCLVISNLRSIFADNNHIPFVLDNPNTIVIIDSDDVDAANTYSQYNINTWKLLQTQDHYNFYFTNKRVLDIMLHSSVVSNYQPNFYVCDKYIEYNGIYTTIRYTYNNKILFNTTSI